MPSSCKMSCVAAVTGLLLSVMPAHRAITQERGGPPNEGFRGGPGEGFRGGPGEGFRGGPGEGFRGGPGGGFRGGPGGGFRGGPGGGPADFLRRLDANGNGAIDPNEAQGPAGFFLQRMAREIPGIDLSRPVPIDRLVREMEQMRERRMRGGGVPGPGDNRPSPGGSPSGGGSPSSSAAATAPLVPGFGTESDLPPVPGFGGAAGAQTAQVNDADRSAAAERIRSYDRNNDGILDSEEIKAGRWRDDPLQYDTNHDGKLTAAELAVRYAKRRVGEQQSRTGPGSSPTNRPPSGPPPGQPAGPPSPPPMPNRPGGPSDSDRAAMMERIVSGMFERYDKNKNGVFDRDEWRDFRSDPSSADVNKDGRIDRREITEWMASRMGGFGGRDRGRGGQSDGGRGGWYAGQRPGEGGNPGPPFPPGSPPPQGGSPPPKLAPGQVDPRKSYRFITLADRLAKLELPDWFVRDDTNGDGQVMMAEFAPSWSDSAAADFARFDLNGDGVITPRECLAAAGSGAIRGGGSGAPSPAPSSQNRTVQASPPAVPMGGSQPPQAATQPPAALPAPTASDGEIEPQYVQYAVMLIKKYDTNRDQVLTPDEWSKMPKNPAAADADGNKQITPQELARALKNSK